MATISVGENRWRMLRRIELARPQPAKWPEFRGWRRSDRQVLEELIDLGLVEEAPGVTDRYRITDAGREVAKYGEIDYFELKAMKERMDRVEAGGEPEPTRPAAVPIPPVRRKSGPKGPRMASARW